MANVHPKAMDAADIRDLLRWQAEAAKRARRAGFDIVYVYAGMGYLPYQFLLPDYNQRTDAYGGSLENRVRLTRQLLEVTKEAVGQRCGVALRVSLEELRGRPGTHDESEAHELVAMLADVPDLWDVKMDSSPTDCGASRFSPEGSHERIVDFVRKLTKQPVVGVGRFTSPDAMVSQIRRGVLDLIGAAGPRSPTRSCPGRSMRGARTRSANASAATSASRAGMTACRCAARRTRPWARNGGAVGIRSASASKGRATGCWWWERGRPGSNAALALAKRGYEVAIADAGAEPGGRLLFEAALPGLAEWRRVLDWRLGRLRQLPNVSLYRDSSLTAEDVLEFGFERVVVATGSRWTPELYSAMELPVPALTRTAGVLTPDDLAAGTQVHGQAVVFDFDNYYMGGCVAELLARRGVATTYVTPAGHASAWTIMSNELPRVHQALARCAVSIRTLQTVADFDGAELTLADLFTGAISRLDCTTLVVVGMRRPRDELARTLRAMPERLVAAGIRSVGAVGDALVPGAIAHAVYFGHKYARELDEPSGELPYRLDSPVAAVPSRATRD